MPNEGRRGLVLFALLVAVAGLGVWGVLRLRGPGGLAGKEGEVSGAGGPRGARLVKGTGTTWREDDSKAEASAALEGTVVDADGKPVDGARVTLGRARGRNDEMTSLSFLQPKGLATSAGGGRFRIEGLLPGDYSATATIEGWAPGVRSPIAVKDKETARVELKLGRGGLVLSGRVLDVGGGAVGGAKVTAMMRAFGGGRAPVLLQSTAGPEGQYKVTLGRGFYGLRVEADGYAAGSDEVFMARHTTKDLRVVPGARLVGKVVERGSKQPVADAEVSLTTAQRMDPRPPRDAKSDSAGRFEFTALEPGSYEVMARRSLLVGAGKVVALAPAQSIEDIEVEVDPGYVVSGRVKDESGAGVGNVRVFAMRDSPPYGQAARTRSNPDGTYALEGMLPGNYRVNAQEEGYGMAFGRARVMAADVGNVDLLMPHGANVTGRVTTADGRPVEGARVQASVEMRLSGMGMVQSGDGATTAADGTFELKRIGPSTLRGTVRHEELGMQSFGPEEVKAGERKVLNLVLKKGASVAGTVRTEDGKPAPDVRITALAREARMFLDAQEVSGPDGRYKLGGLPAGRLTVAADRSGRPSWGMGDEPNQKTLTVADGEDKTGVDLVVGPPGLAIKGVALSSDGKPVPGAIVTAAIERDGRSFRGSNRDLKAYSNLDGQFTLENVARGSYTVWGAHPDFPEGEAKGVASGATGVKLQFPPDTTVSGVVVTPAGKPISHYSLTILPGPKPDEKPEEKRRRQMGFDAPSLNVQDPGGAFELRKLAAGNHELVVNAAGGESATQVIAVQAGERKAGVRIVVQPGLRVVGRVLEHGSGKPIPEASVSAQGLGNARIQGDVAADGTFTLDGAPTGELLRLVVSGDDRRWVTEFKELEVKAGQTTVDAGTIKLLPGNLRERMGMDPSDRGEIGVNVGVENGRVAVRSLRAEGAAGKAGLKKGDRVTAIDKWDTSDLGNGAIMYLISGKPGSDVTLMVESAGSAARRVTLTREAWKPPAPAAPKTN
jgi:protocatechuate 3,4-dioxygenase beta subunit